MQSVTDVSVRITESIITPRNNTFYTTVRITAVNYNSMTDVSVNFLGRLARDTFAFRLRGRFHFAETVGALLYSKIGAGSRFKPSRKSLLYVL